MTVVADAEISDGEDQELSTQCSWLVAQAERQYYRAATMNREGS